MKKIILILFVVTMFMGCSYSFNMNSYPQLKTLYIETFTNKSDEYLLEEELLDELSKHFDNDKRLRLVNDDPDCIISGEILGYEVESDKFTLDEEIIEKKVKILINITFKDMLNDEVIWEKKSLKVDENFSTDEESDTEATTEEEARTLIYEELFDTIIKNTLESW